MQMFNRTFALDKATRILDVGGSLMNWLLFDCQSQITLLNIEKPENVASYPDNISFILGDGTYLNFKDGEFDICYSNSVIEHLSTFENQQLFAQETLRVGNKVWVQTPAKSFFIEPHLITPFIHFFPKKLQEKLLRNFTVWGLITRPNPTQVKQFLQEIRLLSIDEMVQLFPGCQIYVEKFFGFAKAYIAIRG
jgi:hypothetical protein